MSIFGALKKNKAKEKVDKKPDIKERKINNENKVVALGKKQKIFKEKKNTKEKRVKSASEIKLKKNIKVKKEKASLKKSDAWKVLSSPHVTEKASRLAEENQYIFKVFPRAKKIEIKKAVEDIYGVNTESVKIINVSPRKRRIGKTIGMTKGYKKAIVKIAKGQEIEILPR